jgi:hypothetical protein
VHRPINLGPGKNDDHHHHAPFRCSDATERKLRARAGQLGQTLEVYFQQLAEKAVENRESEDRPNLISRPRPTVEEVERLLDHFSSGLVSKVLPPDFSRTDIYDDHD